MSSDHKVLAVKLSCQGLRAKTAVPPEWAGGMEASMPPLGPSCINDGLFLD